MADETTVAPVADEATAPDHVYTKDELVGLLAQATEEIGKLDDVNPDILGSLQKVSQGIGQFADRLVKAGETNDNLLKTVEDYKAKIAAYAADQADRMRSEIEDNKQSDVDAVTDAIVAASDDDEAESEDD